ncbi:GGDEF domain-containing protein [Fontimonas sp. SYSU GA230001]|uniref:GGDEF domain-containing protein n=1 Tax=Fontimonas sp. SYSU GA230001 TaxID=3142450 RepID=UPI0032B35C00
MLEGLWLRRARTLKAAARSADGGPTLSPETVEALERIVERQGPLVGFPDEVEPDYLREMHATSLLTRTLLAVVPALLFCVLALLAGRVLNLSADAADLMRDIAIMVVLPASVVATAIVWWCSSSRATEFALATNGLVLVMALEWLRANCHGQACHFDHTIVACIPIALVAFGTFRSGIAFMLLSGYAAVVLTTSAVIDAPERTMGMWTGEMVLLVIAAITVLANESQQRRNWVARRLIQFQALRDPLTGLRNRRSFEQLYEIASAQARREGVSLCLAIADLDHFKAINDRYGHGRGDDVLCVVAAVLSQFGRRPLDAVARIGGEEFGILLYDCDHASALLRLQGLAQEVRALNVVNDNVPLEILTISVGGVVSTGRMPLSDAYDSADKYLYIVKNAGRNGVRVGQADRD